MAGIKHKGRQDKLRSKIFSKIREITVAAKMDQKIQIQTIG